MPRRKKTASEAPAIKTPKKNEKLPLKLTGMKDFNATDQACFDLAREKAMEIAAIYGFKSIKTPIIESFDLYKKTKRQENDKEVYTLEAEKGEKPVLRPELTQGMFRSYIENNQEIENKTARFFSFGPVFRKEKPQSGSFREINQFDLEVVGSNKAASDALLVIMASKFFASLNIDVQVQINSLGDAICRKEYCAKLSNFYKERDKKTKLCAACKNNLTKNCLSLLDCKSEPCVKLREEAPQIADYLSDASRDYLAKTLEILDELKINYNFNPYLVRGLNYYNDIVFEFWPINREGNATPQALAGGGRYDNLIENLGGPDLPSVGISIGIERAISRIKDKTTLTNIEEDDIVFIAQLGEQAKLKALQLADDLIESGFKIRQSIISDSLKEQLEEARKMKAKVCLIMGKKEIMDGTILMRDVDSGAQETLVFKKVKERLTKKMKG